MIDVHDVLRLDRTALTVKEDTLCASAEIILLHFRMMHRIEMHTPAQSAT